MSSEHNVSIGICYKDLEPEDIDQNDMFNDSGGLAED